MTWFDYVAANIGDVAAIMLGYLVILGLCWGVYIVTSLAWYYFRSHKRIADYVAEGDQDDRQ